MEKKNLDWANLGFGYMKADYRFVSNFKNGAWDEGVLTDDDKVVITECAGVLQYCQSCFEGLKAYTPEDGHVVCFRPDLNAQRMEDSCRRLEMPVFPADRFVDAVVETVKANLAWVPPYGAGASLYIRPFVFATDANFVAFYEAMYRHSLDNVNDYLYYEMQEKFFRRIKEMQ